ncbi:Major facilitator super domain-containing protein 6 [Kappamyces sp. JEL0680]|nr:Major facilitator super domain-containing protein 6 [Kappamyces sp. JEL0680]
MSDRKEKQPSTVPLKALQFSLCLWLSSAFRFLPSFYKEHFRVHDWELGLLLGLAPLLSIYFIPLLLSFSPRRLSIKRATFWTSLLGLAVWSLHLVLPAADTPAKPSPGLWSSHFPYLLAITVAASFSLACISAQTDALTFASLGPGRKNLYGEQRLFASLGWALGSYVCGKVVEVTGTFSTLVYLFIGSMILFLATILLVDTSLSADSSDGLTKDTPSVVSGRVLRQPQIALFCASTLLMGAVNAAIGSFLFRYVAEEWQATPSLLGLTTLFSILLELPLFRFSGVVLPMLGAKRMMQISFLLMTLRLAFYIFLPGVLRPFFGAYGAENAILGVEMLHGAIFALFWSAGMDLALDLAPAGLGSQFTGLFASLYSAGGGALGNVFASWVASAWGFYGVWWTSAALAIGGFLLVSLLKPAKKIKRD